LAQARFSPASAGNTTGKQCRSAATTV